MKQETGFYTVWNPRTGYTMYRHESYDQARAEAERLAAHHRGDRFYVLSALSYSLIEKPVITHRLDTNDDVPF